MKNTSPQHKKKRKESIASSQEEFLTIPANYSTISVKFLFGHKQCNSIHFTGEHDRLTELQSYTVFSERVPSCSVCHWYHKVKPASSSHCCADNCSTSSWASIYNHHSPKHREERSQPCPFHCTSQQSTVPRSIFLAENDLNIVAGGTCRPFSWWNPTKGSTKAYF